MNLEELRKRMRELGNSLSNRLQQQRTSGTLARANQNTARLRNQVANTKLSSNPNAKTVEQAWSDAWRDNPLSLMSQGRWNTGIKPLDAIQRPVGQMGSGVISGLSLGFVNPTKDVKPASRVEQGASIAGNVLGMFNPLSAGSQILGRVGAQGTRLGTSLATRTGVPAASKALGALTSEAAQTGTLLAASQAAGRDFNPVTDLAFGLGARGALGTLGRSLGKGTTASRAPGQTAANLKGVNPKAFALHLDDAEELGLIAEKIRNKVRLSQQDNDTLERTFTRLLPGYKLDKMTNKKIGETLAAVLDRNFKAPLEQRTDFPAMGFAGRTRDIPQKSPARIAEDARKAGNLNLEPMNATDYVRQQTAKQQAARGGESVLDKLRGLRGDIKRKFVDETAAIEDILNTAEKKGSFRLMPTRDIRYQIDKAVRADTLASQFVKDQGLDRVIKDVPDLDSLNQYLIAKHALRVGQKGIATGRNAEMDSRLIRELESVYEPFARQIKQYNDALLDYKVQSGFISQDLADALRREYPDYVPLNRVFSALEEQAGRTATGRGGPASVGTQNVLKRLRGSEREIANPLESIMEATATAFREGERNRAAQMLVSYEKLPGNPFGLRRLAPGEATAHKHTVSAFINGQKVTYETLPEVAEAARNLNPQQFGLLGQLFAVPTRVLRLGAVGVNIPFVLSNLVRDQVFSQVVSQKAMKTSLANPLNFGRALYHAIGHGKLYDDWIRSGSSFTQFDIGRNQTAPTIAKIRAGKSVGSQIAYTARNPGQLLRALEDVIGRSEEVTRLQQYGGTRDALLKQGRTTADADLLAGAASRYNTANFGRKGSWAKVVNGVIPFFSAGIAGARSFVRAAAQNPVGTGVRFSATVGIPVATATAWNLADPARREAYADIPDYEKENNLILLPENPQRDENGNWNAIKIPVTPGLSNLMSIVRRQVEGINGIDNGSAAQILAQTIGDVTAATTSLNVGDPRQLVSTFMKNLPPEEQVRPNTSGTARKIGGALGVSPLMVENAVGTAFAGTGRQLLNLSDRVLASTGAIPQEQVGGRSVGDDLRGRFTVARGGEKANQLYEELERQKGVTQSRNNRIREAFLSGDSQTLDELTQDMTKQQLSSVLSSANERELRDSLTPEQRAIQSYSKAQREELKASRPDLLPDILAVERAERGVGGSGQLVGNYYVYHEDGSQKMIELDFEVPAPKLSGKEAVDKKLLSTYKGKITSKQNDVVKLYEQGVITAEEAEALLASLEAQRTSATGTGRGKKVNVGKPKSIGSVSVKQADPVKITMRMPERARLTLAPPPAISAPPLTQGQNVSTISVSNSRPEPIRVAKTQVRFGR